MQGIIGRRLRVSLGGEATLAFSKIDASIDQYHLPLEGRGKLALANLTIFDDNIVAHDIGPPDGEYRFHDISGLIADKTLWFQKGYVSDPCLTDGVVGRRLTVGWTERTTIQIDFVSGVRFPHLSPGRITGSTIVDLIDVLDETVEGTLHRPSECSYGKSSNQIVEDVRFWQPSVSLDASPNPSRKGVRFETTAWFGSLDGKPHPDAEDGAVFTTFRDHAALDGPNLTRWDISFENALLVRLDGSCATTERSREALMEMGYDGIVEAIGNGSVRVTAFGQEQLAPNHMDLKLSFPSP